MVPGIASTSMPLSQIQHSPNFLYLLSLKDGELCSLKFVVFSCQPSITERLFQANGTICQDDETVPGVMIISLLFGGYGTAWLLR